MSRLAAFDAPPAATPAALRPVPVAEARAEADPHDTVPRPSGAYTATIVVAPPAVKPAVPLSASEVATAEYGNLHNRRTRRGRWLLLGLIISVITAVVIAAVVIASAPQPVSTASAPQPVPTASAPQPGPRMAYPDRIVKTIAGSFSGPLEVAPDGKHVYATCHGDQGHGVVLVIGL